MKKLIPTILLVLVSISAMADESGNPIRTVVLDYWWGVNHAKSWCESHKPCATDPVVDFNDFKDKLNTEFASQSGCRSIRFWRFIDLKSTDMATADAMQKDNWTLLLDFIPGKSQQEWVMILVRDHTLQNKHQYKSLGTPSEIAKKICLIVNNRGAAIVN